MNQVHFSIDDVIRTLRYCTLNKFESIFDLDFFSVLRNWHEQYNIKVTLYCFYTVKEFNLKMLPQKYINEFSDNKDWIKLFYHGIHTDTYIDDAGRFIEEMNGFNEMFDESLRSRFGRFHFWRFPKAAMDYISNAGIDTLFCPDHGGVDVVYDLTPIEIKSLGKDEIIKNKLFTYKKTNLRYDELETFDKNIMLPSNTLFVIFGHEWKFKEKKEVLEKLLSQLHSCEFIY